LDISSKCIASVGPKQKPLLEYVILNMKKAQLNDIIILVGYKAEQIINYFGEGERHGVTIRYVYDTPELRGTGGSLLNLYRREYLKGKDTVLIHYCDILPNISLINIIEKHEEEDTDATIALSRNKSYLLV